MTWRDRIVAWGVGLAAGLLPGCVSERQERPTLTPDAQERFDKVGRQEARGANPAPISTTYDAHPPQPIPGQGTQGTGEQEIQGAGEGPIRGIPARVPLPRIFGPPEVNLTQPPRPGAPPGGSESPPILQAGARGTPPPSPPRPAEEPPLPAALRCFREKRPREAGERLKTFDPPTRDLLSLLLSLAVQVSEERLDRIPPGEMSFFVRQLDALLQALRPRAGLEITAVRFCRKVRRFGDYDPLPAGHAFQAGTGDRPGDFVQVYVELRNFTCRQCGPFYETALANSLTIRDAHKRVFWKVGEPAEVDRLLSRRLDCYLNRYFYVPPGLPAGEYRLVIEVKDVTGLPAGAPVPPHRVAEQEIPFHVAGPAYAGAPRSNAESGDPE